MKIGIDIMGGDFAPVNTVKGAILANNQIPEHVKLVLIGDRDKILAELKSSDADVESFEIVDATDIISMSDHPTKALIQKPNSSLSIGFKLLKEKQIDALCSAGNTGAMLVGSMYSVKPIPGVIRPCITSILPKENGTVGLILDIGINADCKPDVLYQFGVLGSLYAEHVLNIKNPKVGLLNIGEEEEKGNLLTQAAHELMKGTSDFNFVGNVEGRNLFDESADVVVCDGFTGNVVLKAAEGFYSLVKRRNKSDEFFDRFNRSEDVV